MRNVRGAVLVRRVQRRARLLNVLDDTSPQPARTTPCCVVCYYLHCLTLPRPTSLLQVWNLAQEPAHYAGIVAVMHLRENLRNYVSNINAQAAATGYPMMRPMFLEFPQDATCQTPAVEDQVRLKTRRATALRAVNSSIAPLRSVLRLPLSLRHCACARHGSPQCGVGRRESLFDWSSMCATGAVNALIGAHGWQALTSPRPSAFAVYVR